MYRRFIAFIVALSVAITAFGAAPARADNDDLAKAAAAILGIAIVGKIIHDRNKKKDRERAVSRRQHSYYDAPTYYAPKHTYRPKIRGHNKHHRHPGQGVVTPGYGNPVYTQPRPLPRRVDRKLLPGACFKSYETQRGNHLMFDRRCLDANYGYAHRLPQQCAQRVETYRGTRHGYDARCLRRAGYSLARG
ncbi:hypothetical protein ACFSUD_08795 [Sulfitobacter aestuarii]|uniref:Lectin-like protein BA14k n=1 Tax=Sulfitobacter aestuarii TaxID=2161676 RepID=A0ABW5U1Z8_9RHOB